MKKTVALLVVVANVLGILTAGCVLEATPTPTRPPKATATASTTLAAIVPATLPPPTATPSPTAEPGPLPALIAQIPLAPADATLRDLLLDSSAGHLYVTDTAGQLYVLDAATYDTLATLPAAGDLTLDAAHDRLYVVPPYGEGDTTVVDTASLAVMGTISPGGFFAVDRTRNRFYVGNDPDRTPPAMHVVRVYAGATLEKLGEVAWPGTPVYNPLRDDLYIVDHTVHVADPDTLQVTGDLLPEITAQPCPRCTGNRAATDAHVFQERNLLVVEMTILSAGKGPGLLPQPRFFDATSLDELADLTEMPAVERGCNDRLTLADPVNGRVYRGERYSRYRFFNNLLVYDLDGTLVTWRDGLPLGITNPHTAQMYVSHGDAVLVLDLATLTPLGTIPAACIHTLDTETGRIYALRDGDLIVFSQRGGWPKPPPDTGDIGPLPAEPITFIEVSPGYPQDRTLFLGTSDSGQTQKLYRSTDGGQTWARLRGGLPEGDYLSLDLVVSPDFANDRTLFAGGAYGDGRGEGVFRSTDGGDTWQPLWTGLTHLRVYDVVLSPDYANDGTLLAYANYMRLFGPEGEREGRSVFRSTDGGLSWTLAMSAAWGAEPLPPPEELLPPDPLSPAVRFRRADIAGVERSTDSGQSWESLTITREPGFDVVAIAKSSQFARDRTVFVLSTTALYRSTDGGDTWHTLADPRLGERDWAQRLQALAVSPSYAGGHDLFIGSASGEFLVIHAQQAVWEPVRRAPLWPAFLEGQAVSDILVTSQGDLWFGTWGQGVTHFDGQAWTTYTTTHGLMGDYIGGLALTPDGLLWAGTNLPEGVSRFDGQTWTAMPAVPFEEPGLHAGSVFDVAVDAEGDLWVAGQADGLYRFDGERWSLVTDPDGRLSYRVYDVEPGPSGELWCATESGLAHFDGAQWAGYAGYALAVQVAPDGTVYALSGREVLRLAGDELLPLPPIPGMIGDLIALFVAPDGTVWAGSSGGAHHFDGTAWTTYTAQDGLVSNWVSAIAVDRAGNYWFGTDDGVSRAVPEMLGLPPTNVP
ncbi:MAG: two-component regulator propeller domain-containing protein [Anaerolineae bacterium]